MEFKPPKVGILPLYLALYEDVAPDVLPDMEAFSRLVAERLRAQGLGVVIAPVSSRGEQIRPAIADLLGHLSINTTARYARVHLRELREAALPWPR